MLLSASALLHHWIIHTDEFRSQNAFYHLGFAATDGKIPAEVLSLSEVGSRFVDQHRAYHVFLKSFPMHWSSQEVLQLSSVIALAFVSLGIFASLLPIWGPLGSATLGVIGPVLFHGFYVRMISGRPIPFALAALLLIVASLCHRQNKRIFILAVSFFWSAFTYTSLLAPITLVVFRRWILAALSLIVIAVGWSLIGGSGALAWAFEILRTHLGGQSGIYEWGPPRNVFRVDAALSLVFSAISVLVIFRRRHVSRPLWNLSLFSFVLSVSSLLISRMIDFSAIFSFVSLMASIGTVLSQRTRLVLLGAIVFVASWSSMRLRTSSQGDGSVTGDPAGFFAEVEKKWPNETKILFDWTQWSAAFYVNRNTRVEPGFSPLIYQQNAPEAWKAYLSLIRQIRPTFQELEPLVAAFKTRDFVIPLSTWKNWPATHRSMWTLKYMDETAVLATLQDSEVIAEKSESSEPITSVEPNRKQICRAIELSSSRILKEAPDIFASLSHETSFLKRLRLRSALHSLCRRTDLWQSASGQIAPLCDEFKLHLSDSISRFAHATTAHLTELIHLDLAAMDLKLTPSADLELLRQRIRRFDGGARVRTRVIDGLERPDILRQSQEEIFASGQYALWLTRQGHETDLRRANELAERYFALYQNDFDYNILTVRWWSESLALLVQKQDRSRTVDQYLETLYRATRTMVSKDTGCLGPRAPGVGLLPDPHHLSGVILEGFAPSLRIDLSWKKDGFQEFMDGLTNCTLSLQQRRESAEDLGTFYYSSKRRAFEPDVQAHLMNALAGLVPLDGCRSIDPSN